MEIIKMENTNIALVLIDIQKGLDEWDYYGGNRNNLDAEKNAGLILSEFRKRDLPIFHVRHGSTNEKSPLLATKVGFEIKNEVKPAENEPIYTKNVNSAFVGTGLENELKQLNISNIVIVGLTTNHCISTSVRMGANIGFNVTLIADATAAFAMIGINGQKFDAEIMHQTAMASLKDEFATILDTQAFLENL
ncbi:cysteine hydrolase family protein [Spongiivirga citrea]|uniref:Isochorismatase family protein n=1 Tax=Spongiivirga citrea TaxID=1481457 RepID=A0A6M0CIS4_9FLAO|nr:cysteine hydrolase family protein [Spongiivirga citrea]NER17422.1 isochorismatase family protein [Spongiivirga citrea]